MLKISSLSRNNTINNAAIPRSACLKKSTIAPSKLKGFQVRRNSSAMIFKNGYGLLSKELSISKAKTSLETLSPQNAIHGTLWVTTEDKQAIIESVELFQGKLEQNRKCATMGELVHANLNQIVEVKVFGEWVRGKITDSIDNPNPAPGSKHSGLLVLHTEKGDTVVPISEITSLKMPFHPQENPDEQQLLTRINKYEKVNKLRVTYSSTVDTTAKMTYLSRGLCWAPTYKLNLDPNRKKGVLSMNSVVINEAEDLLLDDLICVGGVPSMRFGDVHDPLTAPVTIRNFLNDIQNPSKPLSTPQGSSDLFLYKFKNVNINKDQRVTLPVFEQEIAYTDMYRCKITEEDATSPLVYRAIRLSNTSPVPWTAGSLMILQNNNFIAHNQLTWNPINGTVSVYMNEELGIRIKVEKTTKATEQHITVLKKDYKVFYETDHVVVRNNKSEPVTVLVTRDFQGQADAASDGAVITTHHELAGDVANFKNTIKWEITLQAHESKELTHSYKFLKANS